MTVVLSGARGARRLQLMSDLLLVSPGRTGAHQTGFIVAINRSPLHHNHSIVKQKEYCANTFANENAFLNNLGRKCPLPVEAFVNALNDRILI